MSENVVHSCLVCNRTSHQIPLLSMEYQGGKFWICPQDLPVLIHQPGKLAGILPGIDSLKPPAEH